MNKQNASSWTYKKIQDLRERKILETINIEEIVQILNQKNSSLNKKINQLKNEEF